MSRHQRKNALVMSHEDVDRLLGTTENLLEKLQSQIADTRDVAERIAAMRVNGNEQRGYGEGD